MNETPSVSVISSRLDLTQILHSGPEFLGKVGDRAQARVSQYAPLTVADRLAAFREIGFRPHGLFLPSSPLRREEMLTRLRLIGGIENVDERLMQYSALQDESERLAATGASGEWNGQQAIARSGAKFRVVALGRRGGKTHEASREAVVTMTKRPRSTVWIAAPTMKPVGRCFNMILELLEELNVEIIKKNDTREEKLLVLANGSRLEGISLEKGAASAGTGVDLVIVDEAATMSQESFDRVILPPLADRDGKVILISTWEGTENFFFEEAMRTAERAGVDPGTWQFFTDASWDVNFYVYPQGRQTKSIQLFEAMMTPENFLEEFGSVPMQPRNLIYPQFRERVHVGHYPYQPGHPVRLAGDPSGGANAYAVLAFQDFGEEIHQIDEYYEVGVLMEAVAPELDRRPWRQDVTDFVLDSALPAEIERWVNHGFPAYPVPDKPRPEERFPFQRRLLRDPLLYRPFYVKKARLVLANWGMDPELYETLPKEELRRIDFEVLTLLSEPKLTEEDIHELQGCAHLFIHHTCTNTIQEYLHYTYDRFKQTNNRAPKESPRKINDHCCDAAGYYIWTFHRFDDDLGRPGPRSILAGSGGTFLTEKERLVLQEDLERPHPPVERGALFLKAMREAHKGHDEMAPRTLLRAG